MPIFEVQARKKKDWELDSIYDDKDLAVVAAELLLEGGFYTAVRVVEEQRGGDGKKSLSTIFQRRKGEGKQQPAAATPARKKAAPAAAVPRPRPRPAGAPAQAAAPAKAAPRAKAKAKPQKPKKSHAWLWFTLFLTGGIALAGMAAMKYIQAYLNQM